MLCSSSLQWCAGCGTDSSKKPTSLVGLSQEPIHKNGTVVFPRRSMFLLIRSVELESNLDVQPTLHSAVAPPPQNVNETSNNFNPIFVPLMEVHELLAPWPSESESDGLGRA